MTKTITDVKHIDNRYIKEDLNGFLRLRYEEIKKKSKETFFRGKLKGQEEALLGVLQWIEAYNQNCLDGFNKIETFLIDLFPEHFQSLESYNLSNNNPVIYVASFASVGDNEELRAKICKVVYGLNNECFKHRKYVIIPKVDE